MRELTWTTYSLCKSQITSKITKHTCSPEYQEEMQPKLDVFLLNSRITEEQYKELSAQLLHAGNESAVTIP